MSISVLASSSGDSPLDSSGGLLEAFRASQRREAREQVVQAEIAVEFCAFNSPDGLRGEATLPGTDGEVRLAGEGAPGVSEFAVVEFGAVTGRSTDAARAYLGRLLELRHRLPGTWRQVRCGRVPVWRGLRVAEHTIGLPADGAAWVDARVAGVAGRVGPVVLERLVAEAIVRFDPEAAAQAAVEALESRHATVTVEQVLTELGAGGVATGRLDAVLDVADAVELDAVLAELAADLAAAGDTDPLEVRRAKALGLLARGQTVDLPDTSDPTGADQTRQTGGAQHAERGEGKPFRRHRRRRPRRVVLHVHLPDTALRGCGDGFGQLTTPTGRPVGLVTVEQVQDWCGSLEAQVVVKPVLDLAATITSAGYTPSPRLREQVVAINPTCVFPHCTRPAADLDLDHIEPYQPEDPTTATSTDQLAPLCRRHHRVKTHGGWHYLMLTRGEYLWTSPRGYQWITDDTGTRDVSKDLRDTG